MFERGDLLVDINPPVRLLQDHRRLLLRCTRLVCKEQGVRRKKYKVRRKTLDVRCEM